VADQFAASGLEVVVTGGGGWLGSATLEMLDAALGDELPARVHVFGSRRRTIQLRSGRSLPVDRLSELPEHRDLMAAPHLLAHYAFVTREHVTGGRLDDYVATNRSIADTVLRHAAGPGAVGIFVPSSGAVYRHDGRLDDDLATNPYGALKVADEQRFLRLADGRSASRVLVARVFNLAGPFLNKPDLYALGSILGDILRGGPITVRADRPVIRSYVHVGDLVELAFAAMTGAVPTPPEPIDTAGEREIEVGELATLAAAVLGRPQTRVERPPLRTEEADRYVGDGAALARLADLHHLRLRPLPEQIATTADYLRTILPA